VKMVDWLEGEAALIEARSQQSMLAGVR
jgi:hypothetical protein